MAEELAGEATMAGALRLERTFAAEVAELWKLWTTAEGFGSWYCPEGFSVQVTKLEPVVGGEIECVMRAERQEDKDFLSDAGLPHVTAGRLRFTELQPMRRLGLLQLIDFVPGVAPYRFHIQVEFAPAARGTTMTVTFGPLHDEWMTRMAGQGMASQLKRLEDRFGLAG